MKKLLLLPLSLGLAMNLHALPLYDDFSTYGPTGSLLGGNSAPSGESWILYTNVPTANLVAGQNVAVANYFSGAGSGDALEATLPAGFPTPVAGSSVWVPPNSPIDSLTAGGIGACLQFASDMPNTSGSTLYASFYLDIPAVDPPLPAASTMFTTSGSDYGWYAGFLPASQLPSPTINQNSIPSIFMRFNLRSLSNNNGSTTYIAGVGDGPDGSGNQNSATGKTLTQSQVNFVVISYEFHGGSGDVERLWINPSDSSFGASTEPTANVSSSSANLPDAAGFFFLARADRTDPYSGIMFNTLRIGTNWAYVTGGPQFTSYGPYSVVAVAGQPIVLNATAVAGGVPVNYNWAGSSGPISPGGRYSVGPTGALTIANAQAGDAGTYTLQVSTGITSENGAAPLATQILVTVITSEDASAIASGRFTLNFTGPVNAGYRIWSTPTLAPTLAPPWTMLTSGNFSNGGDSYTDTSAFTQANYYTITVP